MVQVEERVKTLVLEKIADREDLFLVSVKMHGNGKLVVSVDGDHGVSIQDCADISRHVGYHLEEENVIDHAYQLEVSSPGVDEPLQNMRQYIKNVGRNVRIQLRSEVDGDPDTVTKEGKMLEVNDAFLKLEEIIKTKNLPKGRKPPVQEVEIPFHRIVTTKVLISFK